MLRRLFNFFVAPEKKSIGAKAAGPVAGGADSGQPSGTPVETDASRLAVSHGGLKGGKPRTDGLVPGSSEAAAADREKDAKRKRDARAAAKPADTAPLPSAGMAGASAPAPGTPSPGMAGGQIQQPPIVPWEASTLKPLVEKMLDAAEKGRLAKFLIRTQKLGQMPELIKEIEEDAHFPPEAKALLQISLPRCAAKWLNKSGLSAEYQDEIAIVTAVLLIYQHDRKIMLRLDKITADLAKEQDKQNRRQGEAQAIFGAERLAARPAPAQPAHQIATVAKGQPIPAARPDPAGAPPAFAESTGIALGGPQTIATIIPTAK